MGHEVDGWNFVSPDYLDRLRDRITSEDELIPRRNPRRQVKLRLKTISGKRPFYLNMVNISTSGAFCLSPKEDGFPAEPGMEFDFEVRLTGGFTLFCASAVVKRVLEGEQTGIGIEFINIDDTQKEIINRIVYDDDFL